MGFKDVATLLDCTNTLEELTTVRFRSYERKEDPDNLLMQTGMDFFYKTFSNDIAPLKFARNAALKLAEQAGPAERTSITLRVGR